MSARNNFLMQKLKRIRTPVPGAPTDLDVLKKQMARNLKEIRQTFGRSVLEMAKSLGVPESTYKNYESGTVSFIPYDIVATLINIGASAEFLFTGTGRPLKAQQLTEVAATAKTTKAVSRKARKRKAG